MRVRKVLNQVWIYLRNTLLATAGITVFVLFTFLFTRDLNTETYSDRMLFVSIGVMLLGGVVMLGARSAHRSFNIPGTITKPEHAKKLLDNMIPLHEKMEERIDAGIQLWVVGLACLGVSALVQIIGARLAGI